MSGWYTVFMTLLDGCYDGDCGHKGMRLGVWANSLSVFNSGRFLLRDLNVRLNEVVLNSDVFRKYGESCRPHVDDIQSLKIRTELKIFRCPYHERLNTAGWEDSIIPEGLTLGYGYICYMDNRQGVNLSRSIWDQTDGPAPRFSREEMACDPRYEEPLA